MRRPALYIALTITAAVAGGWLAWGRERPAETRPERAAEASRTPATKAAPVRPLACTFTQGERAAYRVASRVTADASPKADSLSGTLSWVVERASVEGGNARLRAALTDVVLEQQLTRQAERTEASRVDGGVFFVEVDARCRFAAITFEGTVDLASQRLVRTMLETVEVVVEPRGASWSASQRDGMGTYLARYERSGLEVARSKDSYDHNGAARELGLRVQVQGSTLHATFGPRTGDWIQRLSGRESIAIRIGDDPAQRLDHVFRVERDDGAFAAVAEATAGAPAPRRAPTMAPVDPATAAMTLEATKARIATIFDEMGRSAAFPAARLLADWLRAHPEAVWTWLDLLRDGALDERTHASFFLALQRAGTEATRDALAAAVIDPGLSEMNRARAASALAEHGAPSALAAGLLREQVERPVSGAVANASLLGLGTMAGRTDGALRQELREFLSGALDGARDAQATAATIDAMGNSGDGAFADALRERLSEGTTVARAHAARALARVAPSEAFESLVGQLSGEPVPKVRLAIARSLATLGERPLTAAGEAAAIALLGSALPEERAAAIEWLGKGADPETRRRLLARHFHDEVDAQLKWRIGTYVSAHDLASSVAAK